MYPNIGVDNFIQHFAEIKGGGRFDLTLRHDERSSRGVLADFVRVMEGRGEGGEVGKRRNSLTSTAAEADECSRRRWSLGGGVRTLHGTHIP